MLIDMERAAISDEVTQACLQLTSGPLLIQGMGGSSVGDVERLIRTIKDRVRAKWFTLRYKLPRVLMEWLVRAVVYYVGLLPKADAPDGRSPMQLLTGYGLNGKRDAKFTFGAYVQTDPKETTNDIDVERTRAGIALMPTGGERNAWVFWSPLTLKTFVREGGVALPIPDELVDKIDAIAEAEAKADKRGRQAKQPLKLRVEHWSIHDSDDDESGYESNDGELEARRERDAREMADMSPKQVERIPNQTFIDPTFASIVPDDDGTAAFGSSSADEHEDAEGAVDPQPMVYGSGIESLAGHGGDQQEESSSDSELEPEPGGGDELEPGGESDGSDADGSRADVRERESEPGGDAAATAAAAAGVQAPAPAAGVQAPPPARPQASDLEERVWVDTVEDEEEDVEPADPVLVSVPEGGSAWRSRLRQNPRKKVAAARWAAGRSRNPTRSRGGKRKCEEAVFNLTVKAAINKLGDAAVVSVAKEILQLQERRTFRRFPAEDITPALAKLIISSSCFLRRSSSPTARLTSSRPG
jgi:hypothetical protein